MELAAKLSDKVPELEETIHAAIDSLPGESDDTDPVYAAGLRATIREVILLAIEAIEADDDGDLPPPSAALGQARRAAKSGVPLETVLRRYAAGERAFISAALPLAAFDLSSEASGAIRRTLGATVDRLMAAAAHEYELELDRLRRVPDDPRYEKVRRLLSGARSVETIGGYPLNAWHVAMVSEVAFDQSRFARGSRLRGVQSLIVRAERGQGWAWFGARSSQTIEASLDEICGLASSSPGHLAVGRGEPRFGVAGFRLSHEEAKIGLEGKGIVHNSIVRGHNSIVRGSDAVLAVAVLRESAFVKSIEANYLVPLKEAEHDAGIDLRRTLRAYLKAGQNATNAAANLGVERRTVTRHLRVCERAIGRTIEGCHAPLQVALDVEMILGASGPQRSSLE